MKIIVNPQQRYAKMRAHTATHLLHTQLNTIFPETKQAGSLVEEDYIRFDYQAKEALSNEQIKHIEDEINKLIYLGYEVTGQEMPYADAIKLGAKAFFADKYGDIVRVITICHQDQSSDIISIELCGGTHVSNTRDIGAFKIIHQEAVATGIKRVVAVTGTKVIEYFQQQEKILYEMADKLSIPPAQLGKKFEKVIKEYADLQDQHTSLQTKLISSTLQDLAKQQADTPTKSFDANITLPDNFLECGFKNIVNEAKSLFPKQNILLKTKDGQYALLANKGDLNAKKRATAYGLQGGGSEQLFQGKDTKIDGLM